MKTELPRIEEIKLIDVYKKEDGSISYTHRFVWQHPQRTCTNDEINFYMRQIYERLPTVQGDYQSVITALRNACGEFVKCA
jgi:phenylalanyl-tRNA synthetase beta subunit